MAIDTAIYVRAPGRASAYLDWLQMLTGAGLVLFMWSHMVLVASVNLGPGAMNTLARFFEDTYMAQVGGPMIGARSHFEWKSSPPSGNTLRCCAIPIPGCG